MRVPVIALLCVCVGLLLVGSADAEVKYHFKPGVEGQTVGNAQFADVAPEVGPAHFKVRLSGAVCGSDPDTNVDNAHVYLDKWGLGVLNPAAGEDIGVQGQVQIDGKCGGEYVRLEFPDAVRLTFLTFASVSIVDEFELFADGVAIDLEALFPGAATIKDISTNQGNWPGTIEFTKASQALPFAQRWDVMITNSIPGDGVQLENVGGEVPEPATIVLWCVGLGILGYCGVRRRAR